MPKILQLRGKLQAAGDDSPEPSPALLRLFWMRAQFQQGRTEALREVASAERARHLRDVEDLTAQRRAEVGQR